MFKIGDFSQFSRISIKMLRHYDELGLLRPAWVDPETGYRYYAADQLPRVQRIVALKALGFRLEQIGVLLDAEISDAQMRGMLLLRRSELEQQLQSLTLQLAQVDARLRQLDGEGATPAYEVVLRAVGPQMAAAIHQRASADDGQIAALFEELEAYVARFEARSPLPPLLLYHSADDPEQAEEIEVLVPVQRPIPPAGRVALREIPGHAVVACLLHTGSYDDLPRAFAYLLGWIERNKYVICGPVREVYLRFGADQQDYTLPSAAVALCTADLVTEIQIPLALSQS